MVVVALTFPTRPVAVVGILGVQIDALVLAVSDVAT